MSIIKRAFLQGLQRSLISSGAIPPYSSKWQQKHALDQAEEKEEAREEEKKEKQKKNDLPVTEEKKPEELTEEQVSEMMTDIVEAKPLDSAIEALQDYQEAAGDTEVASEELAEALEDVKDSKEAALAIRRLKFAGTSATGGGRKGDEMITPSGDFETGYGNPDKSKITTVAQSDFMDLVAKSTETNSKHLTAFDNAGVKGKKSNKKTPTTGEVKAAMAILRKLAGEVGEEDAKKMLGKNQINAEYGEGNPGINPHRDPADIMKARDEVVVPHPGQGQEVLAHLVAKTAQEVGHFLPQELNSTDKLAALRTMVGMNGQERAAYIGRIKEAMYNPYQEQASQDYQAAQVLRNMGL